MRELDNDKNMISIRLLRNKDKRYTTTGQKVWFITGARRGIGSDLVTAALEAGRHVVATGRDAVAVTAEVGEDKRLLPLAMDVTAPSAVDGAVRKALDRFERIDVLINKAGRFHTGFFETPSAERVRAHQISFNFSGAFCPACRPLFERVDDLVFSI